MKPSLQQMWHGLTARELLVRLEAEGVRGISSEEEEIRFQRSRQSGLAPKRLKDPVLLFVSGLHEPLIYILLVSATVPLVLKGLDTGAMVLVA